MRIEESEFRMQEKNNKMAIQAYLFSFFAAFRGLKLPGISPGPWNP